MIRWPGHGRLLAGCAVALLVSGQARPRAAAADLVSAAEVKATFVYNVAKFAEWPALDDRAPIVLCIQGDELVAGALTRLTRRRRIDAHAIAVRSVAAGEPDCQVLFVSTNVRNVAAVVVALEGEPILTVSDATAFSAAGGMIELFAEHDRLRFTVNTRAVERAHLTLSSRLLGLARLAPDGDAHVR